MFLSQAGKDAEVRLSPAERCRGARSSEADTLHELKASRRERKCSEKPRVPTSARTVRTPAYVRVCAGTLLVYSGKNRPCVINYQGTKTAHVLVFFQRFRFQNNKISFV